jgi:hypothetical protein
MSATSSRARRASAFALSAFTLAALTAFPQSATARVTRIVIDSTADIPGQPAYEQLTGRAFGSLDPGDPHNRLITDLGHPGALGADGKATYVASFVLRKPKDMATASGVMWHDVPNRGGNVAFPADSFAAGDVQLLSGWQGDNAGNTSVPPNAACVPPYGGGCAAPGFPHHYVATPVLSGVTGRIVGRIVNRSGPGAAPLNVMGNPIPYFPADVAGHAGDVLTMHAAETVRGVVTEAGTVPSADWRYCGGGTFDAPLPVTSLPVQVCLRGGFDPTRLYQLGYTVRDPYVLGVGTAAFRDVQSFFRYSSVDDFGNTNPVTGSTTKAIVRGVSQSGNFIRHFLFLGMNEDEAGRIVHEGAWPLIAGRRVANNSRWGQPDGVLELYQMGSEGPQWWHKFPDTKRRLRPGGILERCALSKTCPKIVETFGGAEVFALKMTTSWVGTDPKTDIPLPDTVRRYYLPSSTHGGGNGSTTQSPADVDVSPVNCPGNNWGRGTLRANPVPSTGLVNRMRVALREWVLNDTPPPPSVWPRMRGPNAERTLVEATKLAMGFPSGVPGIPDSIFDADNFVFPILDYDWGPEYDHFNASGIPDAAPPAIRSVIRMLVPSVDADGNERGGVPTVQRDAPLGTYLGWNITAGPGDKGFDASNPRPFHAGQVCNYVGGMVPFAITKAERMAMGDPRLSLQERYGDHEGYVAAVRAAADHAACGGYLNAGVTAAAMGARCTTTLPAGVSDDWAALVNQAIASDVLK